MKSGQNLVGEKLISNKKQKMKSGQNLVGEKFAHEVSSGVWGGPIGPAASLSAPRPPYRTIITLRDSTPNISLVFSIVW